MGSKPRLFQGHYPSYIGCTMLFYYYAILYCNTVAYQPGNTVDHILTTRGPHVTNNITKLIRSFRSNSADQQTNKDKRIVFFAQLIRNSDQNKIMHTLLAEITQYIGYTPITRGSIVPFIHIIFTQSNRRVRHLSDCSIGLLLQKLQNDSK